MPKATLSPQEREALKRGELVWGMAEHQGFEEVFRPWLTDKLNQSFPDPAQFTDEKQFLYAAMIASVFKKVIAEELSWIDQQVAQAKHLKAKENGEVIDPFAIGGGEN